MKKSTCTLLAGVAAIRKCARRFFHSYLKETKKKSTVNSYNLISYHFHTKSKGKQP